jgi:type I phosphodiesterase/nucleotide pyrophosphatase
MGDVRRWAAIEEGLASRLVCHIRRERPRFTFAAFTAGDKAAHRYGVDAPGVRQSLKLVDHVVGSIRRDAERDGRWRSMQVWVVSDHGHSPVHRHVDLADAFREAGVKVRSHPWTVPDRSEAAVMVSGNCMAHVYLRLASRAKLQWPALSREWAPRIEWLCSQPAIDLVASQASESSVEVRRGTERAEIRLSARGFSYRPDEGNPLRVDPFENLCDAAAHERTVGTLYPDGVVQLARVTLAKRSGDLVISASPGWDLRRRYEPIDHVSSHGALHAAHMLVPLVGNRRPAETPRRTADLHRLLLDALGIGTQVPQRATLASAGKARGV